MSEKNSSNLLKIKSIFARHTSPPYFGKYIYFLSLYQSARECGKKMACKPQPKTLLFFEDDCYKNMMTWDVTCFCHISAPFFAAPWKMASERRKEREREKKNLFCYARFSKWIIESILFESIIPFNISIYPFCCSWDFHACSMPSEGKLRRKIMCVCVCQSEEGEGEEEGRRIRSRLHEENFATWQFIHFILLHKWIFHATLFIYVLICVI
jgi:hypothetical protein